MTTGTEVATQQSAPTSGPTRMVSVLPYAYWPLPERWGYARSLAHAGDMIPSGLRVSNDIEATTARVFLVLETGAMLNLHPMAALQGIDVIKGTAAISPQTFTGLARAAGMKLTIKEVGTIEGGDFAIEVTLRRPDDDEPIEARFSLKDALRAELISKYEPKVTGGDFVVTSSSDNWRKYPQDMCQWRALGRLARRGAADVTMGIGYFPEELEVAVTEDGVRRDMTEEENALIAIFKGEKDASGTFMGGHTDKAEMEATWQTHHRDDGWTKRVDAEFAAHLSTLTTDTRPPKPGAPGNTGDARIDGDTPAPEPESAPEQNVVDAEVVPDETEPEPRREVSVEASDNAERAQRGFTGGHPDAAAPEGAVTKSGPQLRESEEERDTRIERENYEQYLVEQEAEAARMTTESKPTPLFDPSALEPKPEQ